MTTDFSGYLTAEQLRVVHNAAVAAGLTRSDDHLDVLLAGLPRDFVGSLPGSGEDPAARLSAQLRTLNTVHNLSDGNVPLLTWLQQATALASDGRPADVFEAAIDHVSHTTAAVPPAVAAQLRAAPPRAGAGPDTRGGPITRGTPTEAPPAINTDVLPEALVAGSDQTVEIAFLQGALTSAKSVVKLLVHRHEEGDPVFEAGDEPWLINGTGWFVGPDLVITNHHVINARRTAPVAEDDASPEDFRLQAEHTTVIFDYLEDQVPSVTADTGDDALLAADKELDFAILRVPPADPPRDPLNLRRNPIRKRPQQALGTRVNVLQHPNGDPMRLGFRDNFVVLGDNDWLAYLTDTQFGSSGSPVCDDGWFVAALHSGSRSISSTGLEIRGQRVRRENYGIPISRILTHLEENLPDLHLEILAAQP
ncbi:MAG TPA: trypsin-like peptidase domain-containing protein [Euzebyales bacterium]